MSNGVAGSFVYPLLPLVGGSLTFQVLKASSSCTLIRKSCVEDWRRQQPNRRHRRKENLVQLAITNGKPVLIATFPFGMEQDILLNTILHQKDGISTSSSDWPWRSMFSLSRWMRTKLCKKKEHQVTDTQHTCSLLWGHGLPSSKCVLGMMPEDYGNRTGWDLSTRGWHHIW